MEIPRLHPDTIAEVKDRVDLVDIISDYVVLRKRGREFVGLCPFHEEKTPSFTVSPTKQIYYCFGCGAGGGAIKFLMAIGKQSFSDVVLTLAQRYQIPIKTLAPAQSQEIQRQISTREQLYQILALSASFYQHTLYEKEGKVALDYLQLQRNLTAETIAKFQLGYAPAGWETLFHYLVEVKRYPVALVEQAGLIKKRQKGDGFIDQFRDRLMIPIQDRQGRVIAFGSRSLSGDEPKYLNSPETILFNKSQTLYALDKAKNSIIKQDKVVIVEGYFDAIALHAAGITNVVASLGTAFTQAHLKQLLRYTESKQVILNFDADKAGLKATERAINEIESLVYSGQVQLKILNLPQGKDADEFLKFSPDAPGKYQELVKNAPLWLDWQIEQILADRDLKQANQFQQVVQSLINLLSKINTSATRNHYISHCAELLSKGRSDYFTINPADFQQIQKTLQVVIKRIPLPKNRPNPHQYLAKKLSISSENRLLEEAEFVLLLIYLHCPEYREEIVNQLEEKDLLFSLSHYRFIWQEVTKIDNILPPPTENNPNPLLATLQELTINHPQIINQAANLFNPDDNQKENLVNPAEIIVRAMATLEWIKVKKYYQYCMQQWRKFNPNDESQKMAYYSQEVRNTKSILTQLEASRL
jgi:DNA primase